MGAGRKIIEGLQEAVAGNFSRVTIEGQTWVRFRGKAPPVEIRRNPDESIDEICIDCGNVHIEQMSNDGWFMGVEGKDGSYWQFWFGAKNRKSHVEFRHTEMVPAEEEKLRRKLSRLSNGRL